MQAVMNRLKMLIVLLLGSVVISTVMAGEVELVLHKEVILNLASTNQECQESIIYGSPELFLNNNILLFSPERMLNIFYIDINEPNFIVPIFKVYKRQIFNEDLSKLNEFKIKESEHWTDLFYSKKSDEYFYVVTQDYAVYREYYIIKNINRRIVIEETDRKYFNENYIEHKYFYDTDYKNIEIVKETEYPLAYGYVLKLSSTDKYLGLGPEQEYIAVILDPGKNEIYKNTFNGFPDRIIISPLKNIIVFGAGTSVLDIYRIIVNGVITENSVRLRKTPSTSSEIITQLSKGSSVKVLDRIETEETIGGLTNYWYRVRLKNGTEGWMFGAWLKIEG